MGFPLYRNMKRRVAKKHLLFKDDWDVLATMANTKPGDLIRDCSGFNVRIAKLFPMYRTVGNGQYLVDIDIENDKGGSCSFLHCGVEPAWSRADIVKYYEAMCEHWKKVGDPWQFAARYEFTTVDEEGQATVDYKGFELKYPRKENGVLRN
jgi:hypothetical protein